VGSVAGWVGSLGCDFYSTRTRASFNRAWRGPHHADIGRIRLGLVRARA